jgi:hypothetical protein
MGSPLHDALCNEIGDSLLCLVWEGCLQSLLVAEGRQWLKATASIRLPGNDMNSVSVQADGDSI